VRDDFCPLVASWVDLLRRARRVRPERCHPEDQSSLLSTSTTPPLLIRAIYLGEGHVLSPARSGLPVTAAKAIHEPLSTFE
jgi:hypothetical protein